MQPRVRCTSVTHYGGSGTHSDTAFLHIVSGLFEWRDRKEIECKNAELHQWRKNVYDLNLHITELSLLDEMVADWDSTDVNEYHSLRLEVDSMFQGIAGIFS